MIEWPKVKIEFTDPFTKRVMSHAEIAITADELPSEYNGLHKTTWSATYNGVDIVSIGRTRLDDDPSDDVINVTGPTDGTVISSKEDIRNSLREFLNRQYR